MKKLSILASLIFAIVMASWLAAPACAADPPANDLGQNAALRYWFGIELLHNKIKSDQEEMIDDARRDNPLLPEAVKLVEQCEYPLRYLHQGAAITACDWGLNYEDGYTILLPHLNWMRTFARVATLRAAQRFASGDNMGGVEDIADTLALSRHTGTHDILICILVQRAIQSLAISVLSPEQLGKLDAASLERLAARLDALPPGGSLRRSVDIERNFGQLWLLKQVKDNASRPDWAARSVEKMVGNEGDAKDAVKLSGGTAQGAIEELERLGPIYDDVAKSIDAPAAEWEASWRELQKRFDANAFGRLLSPAYGRAYKVVRESEAQMAELKATVARLRREKGDAAPAAK